MSITATSVTVGAVGTFTFTTTVIDALPTVDEEELEADSSTESDDGCFKLEAFGMTCFEITSYEPPCFLFNYIPPPFDTDPLENPPIEYVDTTPPPFPTGIHCQGSKMIFVSLVDNQTLIFDYWWNRNPITDAIELYAGTLHVLTGKEMLDLYYLDIFSQQNIRSHEDIFIGITGINIGAYGQWFNPITYHSKSHLITNGREIEGEIGDVRVPTGQSPLIGASKYSCSPYPSSDSYYIGFEGSAWVKNYDSSLFARSLGTHRVIKKDGHYHWDWATDPVPEPTIPSTGDAQQYMIANTVNILYAKDDQLVVGMGLEYNAHEPAPALEHQVSVSIGGNGYRINNYQVWQRADLPNLDKWTLCTYGSLTWHTTTRVVFPLYRNITLDDRVRRYISDTHIVIIGKAWKQTDGDGIDDGTEGIFYFRYADFKESWGRHESELSYKPLDDLGGHNYTDMTLAGDVLIGVYTEGIDTLLLN